MSWQKDMAIDWGVIILEVIESMLTKVSGDHFLKLVIRRFHLWWGYTGHLNGHRVENVFGTTFGEAGKEHFAVHNKSGGEDVADISSGVCW